MGFSQVASQALYLDDLFSFFELLARGGRYAELFALQAAGYR